MSNGTLRPLRVLPILLLVGGAGACDSPLTIQPSDPEATLAGDRNLPLAAGRNGGRIAFSSARDGNPEIYVMNADGSDLVRLTNHPAPDVNVAWSPNGKQLAFTSSRDGNPEIYLINADGTGLVNLTVHPAPDDRAAWSPDGRKIAFATMRDGNAEIYVMNADGTKPTNLTHHSRRRRQSNIRRLGDGAGSHPSERHDSETGFP